MSCRLVHILPAHDTPSLVTPNKQVQVKLPIELVHMAYRGQAAGDKHSSISEEQCLIALTWAANYSINVLKKKEEEKKVGKERKRKKKKVCKERKGKKAKEKRKGVVFTEFLYNNLWVKILLIYNYSVLKAGL